MDNSFLNFVIGCAVALLVILIIVGIGAILVLRQLQHFVSPDMARLQGQLTHLRKTRPGADLDSHVRAIIRQQAIRCGIVGALTGLGGFITLPIALPIDLILSMRIQATLVQFIALTYGQSSQDSMAVKVQTYLITTGTVEVTETTFNLIMKLVLRLLGESLSVFIPAIGALIGFGVNYGIAQATGLAALRWYSRRGGTVTVLASRT
jgi:uncharacterized protein (DUF697 family)